jgi:hypothetical protein
MCDNLHLEAFVVVCCSDYGSNEPGSQKSLAHAPHCIWQDSMVYPEQMNQPVWGMGKLNHWEAVGLAHEPQWYSDRGIPENSVFCF